MFWRVWEYIIAQAKDPVTIRGLVFAGFGLWGWKEASASDHVQIITSLGMFLAGLLGIFQPPTKPPTPPKDET